MRLPNSIGFNSLQMASWLPLGGDQQIGSPISEGQIDFVIFFSDPLEPQPHDPDVKALLRIAVVWNIPVACNRASADFLISSPLMSTRYERRVPDYSRYEFALGAFTKHVLKRIGSNFTYTQMSTSRNDFESLRQLRQFQPFQRA